MTFYEKLTVKCKMMHRELEGLTALEGVLNCPEIIARRKADLHELIEHNLGVQSVDWPDSGYRRQRVYSSLTADFMANPDLTISEIAKRHGLASPTAGEKITKELNLPECKKEWIIT